MGMQTMDNEPCSNPQQQAEAHGSFGQQNQDKPHFGSDSEAVQVSSAHLAKLLTELESLREEVHTLRAELAQYRDKEQADPPTNSAHPKPEPPEEKTEDVEQARSQLLDDLKGVGFMIEKSSSSNSRKDGNS